MTKQFSIVQISKSHLKYHLPFWLPVVHDTIVCRAGTTGGNGVFRCLDKTCAGFDIAFFSIHYCITIITFFFWALFLTYVRIFSLFLSLSSSLLLVVNTLLKALNFTFFSTQCTYRWDWIVRSPAGCNSCR
jgi:hypothetical protein